MTYPVFANSVDPDQLASEDNWSGAALFALRCVNFYQQSGSSNLIGCKLEMAWHLNLFSMTKVKVDTFSEGMQKQVDRVASWQRKESPILIPNPRMHQIVYPWS